MIYLRVKIKYRDDTEKVVKSFDTPHISDKWITLYPLESGTKRILIPNEAVAQIEWEYVSG